MAAARGAWVQILGKNIHPHWWNTLNFSLSHSHKYRIHPSDTALQYGPVSTALRDMAENGIYERWGNGLPHVEWMTVASDYQESVEFGLACEKVRSLFLLILSEAICDAGL